MNAACFAARTAYLLVPTLLFALPNAATAQESLPAELTALQDLVERAQYDEAMTQTQALLQQSGLTARQRNIALEVLATARLANQSEAEAEQTLTLLYRRDPEHLIANQDISPPVQAAFARAREQRSGLIKVRLDHRPPTLKTRHAPVITGHVVEGASAVEEVHVLYQQGGREEFVRVVTRPNADGEVRALLPLLDGRDAYVARYYLEAVAPSRAVLTRIGGPTEPLEVHVPRGAEPASEVDEGTPITKKWWFWVGAGVVAAAAVGATIALTSSSSGSDLAGNTEPAVLVWK